MTELGKRRLFGAITILLALSALGWISYGNLGENLVYYLSPSELATKGDAAQGQLVRLGGLVVPGSFDIGQCNPGCAFRVTDGKTETKIASTGLPPQMFREGIGVVVEGELHGDTFQTERIMVKHSNEYKAPENGEKPDLANTLVE